MSKKCTICGTKINSKNNGLFLQEFGFNSEEINKINILINESKSLCINCKKEMMFAGII